MNQNSNSETPEGFAGFQNIRPEASVTLSLLVLLLTAQYAGLAEPGNKAKVCYETDGHYWTVLVVATMLNLPNAKIIAWHSEHPDNDINADGYCVKSRYTFMQPRAQRRIHALTGGNPEHERIISMKMISEAISPEGIGIAAHRLGDSFAHINDKKGRMYPHIIGHTFHWKEPDKIKHNPPKYLRYVEELVKGLGGPDAKIDMSVFYYIAYGGMSTEANSAILKAEYNIISRSIAFSVDKGQVAVVEKYLNNRLCDNANAFVIYSNTDNKGRVTKTVILAPLMLGASIAGLSK